MLFPNVSHYQWVVAKHIIHCTGATITTAVLYLPEADAARFHLIADSCQLVAAHIILYIHYTTNFRELHYKN